MKKKNVSKLFNKNYNLLILVSLIISFGYSMIATLVSSYGVELGAGLTTAGALAGIYSLAALVIRPFGGYATDILDKRKMCVFSTILICLAMTGYALSPGIKTLFAIRVLHGAAFGISGTANMALVCECIPKERLAEGLGYFGLGQVLSQVCGPSIGITIKDHFGYKYLFLLIAVMTVLAVLVLFFVNNDDNKEKTKKKAVREKISFSSLIAKECIVYALVAGIFSLENGIINSFLVLLGEERSIAGIALFFSVNAGVLFLIRLFIGKIADRKSLSIIVNISLITSVISMILVGNSAGLIVVLIAAVLKAIGQGSGQISLQSACIKKVDASKVGIATSTYYIGADIGQGLGPIIGGKISAVFDYRTMFYCVAVMILLAMAVFNIYQREIRKKTVKEV
jgi:predicted MFS family arabinose efflux permease